MTAAEELGWEKVADSLHRYAVPGGWLYRVFGVSEGTTFVPDPYSGVVAEHEAWERGHKAGYMQAMSQQGDWLTQAKAEVAAREQQGDKVKPADEQLFAAVERLIEIADRMIVPDVFSNVEYASADSAIEAARAALAAVRGK